MADTGKVLSVQCNHCGAPLEIEDTTRFVTCAHCGSKLEVKRMGGSYFTSVLERIDQTTQSMAESLEIIRLQNELERVDREWEMNRTRYAVRDRQGNVSYPGQTASTVAGIAVGTIAVIGAILWAIIAFAITSLFPNWGPLPIIKVVFPLFGVFVAIIVITGMVKMSAAVSSYQNALARYQSQRAEIESQIDRQKR